MHLYCKTLSRIAIALVALLGVVEAPSAQEDPVIAIDIVLEPDSSMIQRATAANGRLLEAYPNGFALDEAHRPHMTMLQQFVRADALNLIYAAANAVLAREKPAGWTLRAIKYYDIPIPPLGVAGIVVEPTYDLRRLQDELIAAVAPYSAKTGTAAAFFSDEEGRDIQPALIDYVANFVHASAGVKFNPHVTIGVAPRGTLDAMLAQPFEPFTFSPAGASVYQLGTFGTARKALSTLTMAQ